MQANIDDADTRHRDAMRSIYDRWAGIYDFVYAGLLRPGQRKAVTAAVRHGRDLLEVGVGTGLALDLYPGTVNVTGVDLSPQMLAQARRRVRDKGLTAVRALAIMDAGRLEFADASFDAVLALYVLTLLPDPEAALDGFARVVRPGGGIIVVSHLGADNGPIAVLERAIAPLTRRVGWSSDFRLSRIAAWAEQSGLARIVDVRPALPGGFFKVVKLTRTDRPIA